MNEFEGKTVEEAINHGLAELGLEQDDVEIEILNPGNRGVFGIGIEPAVVRLVVSSQSSDDSERHSEPIDDTIEDTRLSVAALRALADESNDPDGEDDYDQRWDLSDGDLSDDDLMDMCISMLARVIDLMDFESEIEAFWVEPESSDDDRYLQLNVTGDDLGALIGRRGDTLASIQYLLRLMVNQRLRQWKNIVVDIENYKARRVDQLTQLALRMAEQVADSGRSLALEPMPANERRIVHVALRDHPDVYTESIGEDDRRKVHIIPG